MNSLWTCFFKCKLQSIKNKNLLPTKNINLFVITWAPCCYTLRMMINYVVTLYCVRMGIFGEWRYIFIVYVVVQMQSHL
jgi:hypothetical protein